MNFQEEYRQKLTTADEAVKVVQSGNWLDYGWTVCSANALDKALAARMGELKDVNIRGGILTRRPAIFDVPDAAGHFAWNSWHMSGIERKAITGTASRRWTWPCSRWLLWMSTVGSTSVPAVPT